MIFWQKNKRATNLKNSKKWKDFLCFSYSNHHHIMSKTQKSIYPFSTTASTNHHTHANFKPNQHKNRKHPTAKKSSCLQHQSPSAVVLFSSAKTTANKNLLTGKNLQKTRTALLIRDVRQFYLSLRSSAATQTNNRTPKKNRASERKK